MIAPQPDLLAEAPSRELVLNPKHHATLPPIIQDVVATEPTSNNGADDDISIQSDYSVASDATNSSGSTRVVSQNTGMEGNDNPMDPKSKLAQTVEEQFQDAEDHGHALATNKGNNEHPHCTWHSTQHPEYMYAHTMLCDLPQI